MKKCLFTIGLVFLIVLLLAPASHADETGRQKFDTALKAYYDNKDYDTAEALFQDLLHQMGSNAYLDYNLGNVYLKRSDLGKAVLYYEKAKRLIPRYADLNTNLKRALDKMPAPPQSSFSDYVLRTFYFWSAWVSAGELRLLFLFASLIFWGGLAFKVLRRKSFWTTQTLIATLFFCYLASGTLLKSDAETAGAYGVVLKDKSAAKASFLEKDQPLFYLTEGTKVHIIDTENLGDNQKWLRIALPQGQQGWVSADDIGVI